MLHDGKKIREKMYEYLKDTYEGSTPPSWSIKDMLRVGYSFKEAEKQFKELEEAVNLDKKMKILDAGCGFGYFVSYCIDKGYDCYGYEIDPRLAEISRDLLRMNHQNPEKIKLIGTNKLTYPKGTFDVINMHFVLDCVTDIPSLLKKLKTILKVGGKMYSINPNYYCLYNPVYSLIFIPWLPIFINRIYFRLMGRPNMHFLESLTFTTPRMLENIFNNENLGYVNLGYQYWEDLISNRKLSDRSNFLRSLVKYFKRYKLTFFLRLVGKLGFYTPLVYVVEKRKNK